MRNIEISNLSKSFDENRVIENLTMTVPFGQVTGIMAPSGTGKTTLINMLSGLEQPDEGTITGIDFATDKIAMVFQEDRLCENYSALSNIKMVLGKKASEEEIIRAFQTLGIEATELKKAVKVYSGGMKRRVAIVRAVLYMKMFDCSETLLILDEPFKGLDENLKAKVMAWVKSEIKGRTVILVTHDRSEIDYFDANCVELGK